jgi:hypothetical protein
LRGGLRKTHRRKLSLQNSVIAIKVPPDAPR